jgi:hypothetical protein
LSIIISELFYVLYIFANLYPEVFLVPSAALVGIAAGPLWTSK